MKKQLTVDLTLLKKLVSELELTIDSVNKIMESVKSDKSDFAVEMFKAAGVCAGISREAGLLVTDIMYVIHGSQNQTDLASTILQFTKNDTSNGN